MTPEDGDGEVVLLVEQAFTPGMEAQGLETIRRLCEAVHAQDEGCILYAGHAVAGDPTRIVAIERWASQAALEAHAAKAHVAVLAGDPALAGPPTVTVLTPLRFGDPAKGAV